MKKLNDALALLNTFCFDCPYGYCYRYEQEDEICPIKQACEILEEIANKEA